MLDFLNSPIINNPLLGLPLAFLILFLIWYAPPLILTKILTFFAKSESQKENIEEVLGPLIFFVFIGIMWMVIFSFI